MLDARDAHSYPYGYSPLGGEVLARGKAAEASAQQNASGSDGGAADAADELPVGDVKEMFAVGPHTPPPGVPAPRWPTAPRAARTEKAQRGEDGSGVGEDGGGGEAASGAEELARLAMMCHVRIGCLNH